MKKINSFLFLIVAMLAVIGCERNNNTTKKSTKTGSSTVLSTVTTTKKTDSVFKKFQNVGELMTDKRDVVITLLKTYMSDVFETSTGISYDAENIIFSAVDVDETATTLTNADYTFAYKNGETERKYFTATAEFNEVSLADLADGKTTNFYLEDATRNHNKLMMQKKNKMTLSI